MIRINLLPFRAARKQENIRRQISIYFLLVLFFAAAMGYFFLDFNRKVSALNAEMAQKKKELAKYRETNRKIALLNKKLEDLRNKLDVIRRLEKNKTGPVRLLEEIAQAVPKDKLWLRSINEQRGILTIEGTAMDNEIVALFMTTLAKKDHITAVDLTTTQLKNMQKYKMDVTEFVLKCKTYMHEEPPEPKKPKRRRRG
jgi:type IV pilus assembly protein PilN